MQHLDKMEMEIRDADNQNSNSAERVVGKWTSQKWGEFQVSCDSDLKAVELDYNIILFHGALALFLCLNHFLLLMCGEIMCQVMLTVAILVE